MLIHHDHLKRWITGVVALTLVVLVVGYGSKPAFFLFSGAVILFALNEYFSLVAFRKRHKNAGIVFGAVLVSGFCFVHGAAFLAVPAALIVTLGLFFLRAFVHGEDPHVLVGNYLLGLFGIAFLLAHVIWLRDLDYGRCLTLYLLTVIVAGDTCALYGGKLLGRHPLAPIVSPKKTVEGALAGLMGSCLAGVMVMTYCLPYSSVGLSIALSLALGIAGQVGDLWESALKRVAGVKDSSCLLPGHGGFLDRIDSLLFSGPLLYYAIQLLER